MKKMILVLLILVVCIFNAIAQTKGIAVFLRGGYIYAHDAKNIFTQITPYEISGFTNNFALLGIEGYYRKNKWIIGLEGSMGAQKDYSKDKYQAEPYVGAGHVRFGHIIYEGRQYWVYPSFGTGASVTTLSVKEKLLNKTGKIMNLSLYSPSFDLCINGDLLPAKETKEQKRSGGLILGFRAGYRFSLESDNWKDDKGNKQNNMPPYRNNAFYVTLIAAGGYFVNK